MIEDDDTEVDDPHRVRVNDAFDSFADQHRSPATDHAEFVNVMTVDLMAKATRCINAAQHC